MCSVKTIWYIFMLYSHARSTATQETQAFISIAVIQCQALKPLEAMIFKAALKSPPKSKNNFNVL